MFSRTWRNTISQRDIFDELRESLPSPLYVVHSSIVRIHIRETSMEMLRLNPGDNQGQRDSTGTFLLKAKRTADALSFVQHWLEPEVRKTGLPPPRGGCVFETPSKQPLSAEILASWEGDTVTHAGFVYTAAFASFKLWGDCQLARQYLVIAARLNPHVLLKILAKVDQPSELFLCVWTTFQLKVFTHA